MTYIFDLDGVLCDDRHRQHHLMGDKPDWEAYYAGMDKDAPIQNMVGLLIALAYRDTTIILTGRPEKYRKESIGWLHGHRVPVYDLIMRPDDDNRSAPEFKLEIVRELIPEPDKPHVIFDDTYAVIVALREAGYFAIWVPRPGWPKEDNP